jgi:acyl dehydratase
MREGAAPYFDDLERGQVDAGAPALTLTAGHSAVHQAILGDRLRLGLDGSLCAEVLGQEALLAHPGLVCDVAIGQSTRLTQRVIGNLFYRGLVFHRLPLIGDTLRTSTEVVALRQNSPRPGRAATGLAGLRIRTVDQEGRAVLPGAGGETLEPGQSFQVSGADVVSSAPELARLTLNIAFAHHDAAAGREGRRLVYGGHTIGVAAAQLSRALPNLVTVLGWESCDHLGPVFEGDSLLSTIEVEDVVPLEGGGSLARLRSRVVARDAAAERAVLDWRLYGAVA